MENGRSTLPGYSAIFKMALAIRRADVVKIVHANQYAKLIPKTLLPSSHAELECGALSFMSRFVGGWIAVSNKMLWPDKQNNPFYGDSYLIALWMFLISWANWKDGKTRVKNQDVIIKRGQLVTSQDELSEAIGASRSITRTRLQYLENTSRISQQKSHHGTIITILKYDEYQTASDRANQRVDQQIANASPTDRQQIANASPYREQVNKGTSKHEDNIAGPKGPAPSLLMKIWNENRGPLLAAVQTLSKGRDRKIRVRLNEKSDPAYWEDLMNRIVASPFLCGENDRGWRVDFDWLIVNDTNHVKVAEGKYGGNQSGMTTQEQELARLEARYQAAKDERL